MPHKGAIHNAFSENTISLTLVTLSLATHFICFFAMLYIFGPFGFYLSNHGVLDGNDGQHYIQIALNLAEGNGYSRFVDSPYEPDGLRTPLLSLYFLPFFYFGGLNTLWLAILFLNIALSFLALMVYKLARLYVSHWYAAFAGIIATFDPWYLYRSQIAEPDALFMLLMLLGVYLYLSSWKDNASKYWYLAYIVLGINILLKPTALYIVAILFAFEIIRWFFFHQKPLRHEVFAVATALLIVSAVISPWLMRNRIVFDTWGISSIAGFNLYEFYTTDIKLPNETVPESIIISSREPSRWLPNQKFFLHTAYERIFHSPVTYAREQTVGSIRNLFVSELPVIYYYKHASLLPFPYNPEAHGGFRVIPKLLWYAFMVVVYMLCLVGLIRSWREDKHTFLAFGLFLTIFAYLIIACGPYVDAKYRMPAMPLVLVIALYGLEWINSMKALRGRRK